MKFRFCQNMEKLDSIKLLSFLLTRYIELLLKTVRQVEKRKFSRFCDTQLPTVCLLPFAVNVMLKVSKNCHRVSVSWALANRQMAKVILNE